MRMLAYADTGSWVRQMRSLADALGAEACIAVPGRSLAEEAAGLFDKVLYAELGAFNPESLKELLAETLKRCSPDIVATPCSNKGRVAAGLCASMRGATPISDVVEARVSGDAVEARRLVFGGSAVATVEAPIPVVLCLSPGAYPEAEAGGTRGEVEELSVKAEHAIQVEYKPREAEGVEPDKADVVVVAGRGVKKAEDLAMIRELADLLDGAWSVTRPLAADYGWSDTWIGISGLVVSPRLYIGVGVSGQPHHMMGVRGSKVIVAINKDPNAPIFEEADYGLVGDLYKILPVLIRRIKETRG